MNLLDLAVKITCDDQASGEVEGIGRRITSALGTAAKVGGAAIAALGTAAIAVGKTALDAFADYEQLVGGMDTLFKGASATIQRYAADAYKTAGVSANRYMQITTSFAASLISSLGGDTARAAEMANMAITDMSDNANKMGTSLEVVQEAYMSLARGNYEMLDSLALGYAGTKTGLEQLLADAERYAAAQGEVRDFSVDSYADIVEAIHIVQTEMGITGTTAEEAAATISGSINMAKAAWDNWLAGLGNEDADMTGLTENLVASIDTAMQNVIPRVVTIMSTLGTTIGQQAPVIAQHLYDGLMSALPPAVSGPLQQAFAVAGQIVGAFGQVFTQNIQPAMDAAAPIISAISSGFQILGANIQSLVLPAIEQLSPIFQSFFEAVQAAEPVLTLIASIFGVVLASALSVAVQIFGLLVQGVTGLLQIMQGLYDFVVGFVAGVIQFFTVDLPAGFSAFIAAVSAIPGQVMAFLSGLLASVAGWVGSMVSQAVSAGSQFVSNIVSFISDLPGRIAGFLGSVISNVGGFVGDMASGAVNAASEFASNLISGLQSIPGKVVSIGGDIIRGMKDGVVNAAHVLIDAVGDAVNGAIDWAKGLLGIASPSKVFREFGRFSMQGMALGIEDEGDAPVSAVGDTYSRLTAVPMPALQAVGTGSGVTYNITVDGSLVTIDSRIGRSLDQFVSDLIDQLDMR